MIQERTIPPGTTAEQPRHRYDTIVIGAGQAGLTTGYFLKRHGRDFVILDAHQRIGDAWRKRWDSLRLFTPAEFNGLVGMPFPAPAHSFPTKDEMADYLEHYATHFNLPVRTGVRVSRLSRQNDHFLVEAGEQRFAADHVVVAMANYQQPKIPTFAQQLDPAITQLHSFEYRNLSQLRDGSVLVVGAGNSGAEIGIEIAAHHPTLVAGRSPGQIPFRTDGRLGLAFLDRLVLRGLFHRVLTIDTPMGRNVRPKTLGHSGPLVRTKEADLAAAGVERVPRMVGVQDGRPALEDGRVLDVANVVWCTGFHHGFDWIDLPVLNGYEPRHRRGLIDDEPGLYFVGLHFLYAMSSVMIHGVARDAQHVVEAIVAHARSRHA